MASSLCQVKVNAGAFQAVAGGINVSPGDTITIKLASSAGVNTGQWSISCINTDETKVPATITALLTVNQSTFEATFTVPAGTGQALIYRSEVNADSTTRTTFGLYVLVGGYRVGATDETFEGDATYGWITKFNAFLRAGGGGGYTAPTGTGLPHIVAGVQQAAASLVVNADVDAAAAIALSKLVNPTGTGLVKTTAGAFNAAASLLLDADVDAAAAIALSKIVNPTGTGLVKTVAGAIQAASALLLNADVDPAAAIALSKLAPLIAIEDNALTGTQHDLALATASTVPITIVRFTDAAGITISSIAPGASTLRFVVIVAAEAGLVEFQDESAAGGTAANRLIGYAGNPLQIQGAYGVGLIFYDTTSSRWRQVGRAW